MVRVQYGVRVITTDDLHDSCVDFASSGLVASVSSMETRWYPSGAWPRLWGMLGWL